MTDAATIAAKLTKAEQEAVLADDPSMSEWFDLVDLDLADYETNSDDDMFFWLTDLGQDVREILEQSQ